MINIEIKFLRGILCSVYKNSEKVISLEKKIYEGYDANDSDINSVIDVLNKIKNKEYIETNFLTLKSIYENLFPSLKNKKSGKELDSEINKIVNIKEPENILVEIATNTNFNELNYSMSAITINILNYKKDNRLTVIPLTIYDKICKYMKHDCKHLLSREFENIKLINENYYRIKQQTTIEHLRVAIEKIPRNKFKLLNIHSISIYGSYAKQTNNQYSDVDFHVVLKNDKYDLDISAKNIKYFLEKELSLNVDVITTVHKKWFHEKYNVFFMNEILIYE